VSRLQEIETRMAAINEQLNTGVEADIDALETEVNSLTEERNKLIEKQEKRAALLGNIAKGAGASVSSFERRTQETADMTDSIEYRKTFMDYVIKRKAMPGEFREATMTTDVGAVIPTTIMNRIVEKMEVIGNILPLITRTAYQGGLSIPVATVKPVASWIAEGAAQEPQKVAVPNSILFGWYKLRCPVSVTLETSVVTLPMFETFLVNGISNAMTKALETAIISGTGTGQPTGILTQTPPDGQVITATDFDYQLLIDAEAALPQAYENGAIYCMSKKTFMRFAGMVDSIGQPIARVNFGIGRSPERTLLGRNVVISDQVPNTGNVAFLYNFSDYILNTNMNITVKTSEDDRTDDIITRAIMLADGKPVDVNSLVVIQAA